MKVSIKKIVDVYRKKGCNISATCEALGISRQSFYNYKDSSEKLREQIEEADEAILDFAESKLMEHINNGDVTSLIFLLKTKGKKRGYVERTENVVSNPFLELMKTCDSEDNE